LAQFGREETSGCGGCPPFALDANVAPERRGHVSRQRGQGFYRQQPGPIALQKSLTGAFATFLAAIAAMPILKTRHQLNKAHRRPFIRHSWFSGQNHSFS